MVDVFASVNLPLHRKVQKFSGTSSPGWSRKEGRKTVVVVVGGVELLINAWYDNLANCVLYAV